MFKNNKLVTPMHFVRFLKNQRGMSFIAIIVTIMMLGTIGVIMGSLMSRMQESTPRTIQSTQAFYLGQAGVEYAGEYLTGQSHWNSVSGSINRSLGSGSFTIAWGSYDSGTNTIPATVTGSVGTARRMITAIFEKPAGSGLAIDSKTNINAGSGAVYCGSQTCNNTMIQNGSCDCTKQNSTDSLPAVSVPGGLPAPSGGCTPSGTYTWSAGTYFCTDLNLNSGAIITLSGPVTVYVNNFVPGSGTKLNMNSGSQASNLLIMVTTGGNVNLNGNSQVKGFIYAPGSTVIENDQCQFYGRFVGNSVTMNGTSYVTWDAAAGSACPNYSSSGSGSGGGNVSITGWSGS